MKGFIYSETWTHVYITCVYHSSKTNPVVRQFFFFSPDFDIILTCYSSKKNPVVNGFIYSGTSTHVYIIYEYHSSKTNPVVRQFFFIIYVYHSSKTNPVVRQFFFYNLCVPFV